MQAAGGGGFGVGFSAEQIMIKIRLLQLLLFLLAWTSQGSAQLAYTEHKQIEDAGGKALLVRATNLAHWIVPEEQLQPATKAEAGASGATQIPANKIQVPKGTSGRDVFKAPIARRAAQAVPSLRHTF